MPRVTTNTRIAIAQVRMHWTLEENLSSIYDAMRLAQAEGAGICAFSELAITGFHRKIASLAKPDLIDPAIENIKNLSAELKLAVALGRSSAPSREWRCWQVPVAPHKFGPFGPFLCLNS